MSTAINPPPAFNPPPNPPPPTSSEPNPEAGLEDAQKLPKKPHRRRNAFIPGFRDRPPFLVWLRNSWLDITTQLLTLLTAFLLYTLAQPLMPRYFPLYPGIERSAWGLKYGLPYRSEYITTAVSAIVAFFVPVAIMGAIALWGVRDFRDGNAALVGIGYALATTTLFHNFIKIFIGGLRPHFLSICAPAIPPPVPGIATPGPSNGLFYTASQVCTGDKDKIKEAQMSFPSGHSTAAFAGFGFLALWLNAKFKVFGRGRRSGFPHAAELGESQDEETVDNTDGGQSPGRIRHWKLVMFAAPWCTAVLLAGSKVRDGWHHPVDVIFGGLIGTAFAHMAFRMVYRSVYDWRDNHIPLEK